MMRNIILASESATRRKILEQAGIVFDSVPAHLAEDEMMLDWQKQNLSPRMVAQKLAFAKAEKISKQNPNSYVIGSDQMLICEGRWFARVSTIEEARENLRFLCGKTHHLITAYSLLFNATEIASHADEAEITMRKASEDFLDHYLQTMGSSVFKSVGCYQIEGLGAQLIDSVRGNHFSILGLPLLPLLSALRQHGVIAS